MSSGKKILLAAVGLVVAAGIGSGVYSYLQRGVVRVQTGKVARQDLVSVVTASGEVKPRNYINIGADSMGRLTDIYVREGDMVEPGQELAKLETVQPAAEVAAQKASLALVRAELAARDAAIESNEANQKTQQASLKRSQAELRRAKINYGRASELLEDKLIARQDYDQRRADYDAAQAAVEEAAARLEQLRAQREEVVAQRNSAGRRVEQTEAQLRRVRNVLEKHYSVAPIEGVVTNLPVRVGETVVPGIQNSAASLIMTIADMSLITAEVKVDETDIVNVTLGQVAEVSIDAIPGQTFSGRVTEIGNTAILRTTGLAASQSAVASQEAKDFKVVVALDAPTEAIRPGMSCTARITTATRERALTVPIQALTVRESSDLEPPQSRDTARAASSTGEPSKEVEGVFVVSEGSVEFRPVRTGITGATRIEVIEGLEEGEEIVTGSYKVLRTIRPGASVKVDNELSNWGRPSR